jgi:excinuclease ABC subunit C
MEAREKFKEILQSLPYSPGVYQFYDKEGQIIYVGKAKNLKNRVRSYFSKNHDTGKLKILVSRIEGISYIVVKTEWDALLLENSLIKKHQPRYNVMLKDDKTYPWICIKNEPYPRIFSTRRVIKDGSEYFGPYSSVRVMNTVLDFVRRLYPLRNCNLNLTPENIRNKKFRHCLEYDIGNCKAPCEGWQSDGDYDNNVLQIRQIIKGNLQSVTKQMKNEMDTYSRNMDFERAQDVKEKLELLERYQSRSTIVSSAIHNVDVFSIITDERNGYVNFLKVMNGAIVAVHTLELKKKLDETPEELLLLGITELRKRIHSDSKEIIVPLEIHTTIPEVSFTIPQKGDKKKLLEFSENNLKYFIREKKMREEMRSPEKKSEEILEQMKKDLRLQKLPRHIECFDNSNIQGSFPVAAMTVFKNTKPSKSDYRHYTIRSVQGPDDFASMEEVIHRRYKRVLEEKSPLPDLIVIDGGKGQISAAMKAIDALGLDSKIPVIGIAKRLEEIYFPGDSIPLYLDKRSSTLRIIQQIRDEAHRFGITHHRKRRSKESFGTSLTGIKGIGELTAQKLLKEFGSVERIRQADEEAVSKVVGRKKANLIFQSNSRK